MEVDGVSDDPTSENAAEGKEPDGIKLNLNSCLVTILNILFVFKQFSSERSSRFLAYCYENKRNFV